MTMEELTGAVANAAGLTKITANKAIAALFDSIQNSLRQGDKITIAGFGTFEVADRAARQGRNPQTGEAIAIAATRMVKFKPGKGLKNAVKG